MPSRVPRAASASVVDLPTRPVGRLATMRTLHVPISEHSWRQARLAAVDSSLSLRAYIDRLLATAPPLLSPAGQSPGESRPPECGQPAAPGESPVTGNGLSTEG